MPPRARSNQSLLRKNAAVDRKTQRERVDISARIRKALVAAGLNQLEAARRASAHMPAGRTVSRDAIHKAVIRGSMPREKEVRDAIARTLGVTPQWLWYGEEDGALPPAATKPQPQPLTSVGFRPDPQGYTVIVDRGDYEPAARRGDMLYVTPSYPARIGDRVLVEHGGEEHLYRLIGATETTYRFIRPDGSAVTVKTKDCTKVHRIAGAVYD